MNSFTSNPVKIVALGGLGEIGLNLMVLECGEHRLIIDAGLMFAPQELPGTDLIIPELSYLKDSPHKLAAIVLTHAHEDHIGALPFLLREFSAPVYGSELTLAFARERLRERAASSDADLRAIGPGERITAGPFSIEGVRVTHSTPDSLALAIGTPAGMVVHSGDFKIDSSPVDGQRFDSRRFAALGEQGVLLLLSDSTNAERSGRTESETSLRSALGAIMAGARGRVFLSSFSSHIHRIRQVAELSHELGRRVAPLGRRMVDSTRMAVELGHLSLPPGTLIDHAQAEFLPANKLTFVASGSQGEPLSALAKLARDVHPRLQIEEHDTVILSSRFIPGNERAINDVINQLHKRGAVVQYEPVAKVHVSGHASRDELAELIRLTRPRYFVPIHGEYRHLVKHIELAVEAGLEPENCFLLEDGEPLQLEPRSARRLPAVECGTMWLEDGRPTAPELIRERQSLARAGIVFVTVAVSRESGRLVSGPELISRGCLESDGIAQHSRKAAAELRHLLKDSRVQRDPELLKEQIIRGLRGYFGEEIGRRPVIIPCVMEV